MNEILMLQNDGALLLDCTLPVSQDVEKIIQRFCEHSKTIGQYEQYYISALSVWNAISLGLKPDKLLQTLHKYKKFPIPLVMEQRIQIWIERYGKLTLKTNDTKQFCILMGDQEALREVLAIEAVKQILHSHNKKTALFSLQLRGRLKQLLVREGFNVIDECGFQEGEALRFELLKSINKEDTNQKEQKQTTQLFELRDYQRKAIAAFHRDKIGGSGVIVLPCGAGKTLTGIGVMASLQCATLIITSNVISCEQWKEELLSKTSINSDQVGIYGGERREVKPITIATYHILSYRQGEQAKFPHMALFNKRDWGLIIYDEVHLLPAPVFRMTASIQATRRLGLTATLIREDGCAPDVYSLVGPKLYDLQWKEAEQQQVIAQVECYEIHIPFTHKQQTQYKRMNKREQYKFASTNTTKLDIIKQIVRKHEGEQILIIGQYIEQLEFIAEHLEAPLITGQTSHAQRQQLFELFREQKLNILILSKIANLALNLPSASVAIQVSGSYGSRQEEAQRIGRIVRPKQIVNHATFYTVVTSGSIEEQFSLNRGRFMEEQGYRYNILTADQLIDSKTESKILKTTSEMKVW